MSSNKIEPAELGASGGGGGGGGGGESSRTEKASLSQVKKRPVAPRPQNDFLCVPKYVCNPPDPPMDLKLIDFEPDLSVYAPYRTTDLDRSYKRPMYTNTTFGVRVNLVNLDEYSEYAEGEGPPLEDATLLESDSEAAGHESNTFRRKTSASASAPFLRSMFYDEVKIDKIDYGGTHRRAGPVKNKTRDELLAEVLEQFHAAKQRPLHPDPRKRHLKAVEVLPVFPDFENFNKRYVVAQFEDDPKKSLAAALEKNLDHKEALPEEDAQEMVDTAVTVGSRGEDNEAFLSYYVPLDEEVEERKARRMETGQAERSDRYATANVENYHLAREYLFNVRARDTAAEVQKMFLLSRKDKFATYCEISSRLALHKRIRRDQGYEDAPQTKRLVLKRTDPSSADQEERTDAVMQVCVSNDTAELANQLEQ